MFMGSNINLLKIFKINTAERNIGMRHMEN